MQGTAVQRFNLWPKPCGV